MTIIDRFLQSIGLEKIRKEINPYTGLVSGQFWSQTGMPWVSSEGRKAVLTEWFWQPIRGQPRRVDTNELRKFSQTLWIYNCIQTIINEITSLEWDIVPKDEYEYEDVKDHIREVKLWLEKPNENKETMESITRAFIKDILELDAGVIVKVFTKDSYDFEHLEPKSGAPILKPLFCPYCAGSRQLSRPDIVQTVRNINHSISSQLQNPNAESYYKMYSEQLAKCVKIEGEMKKAFAESKFIINCPFCNGTGKGRTLKELYVRDGSSFLKEADKFGYIKGYWQYSYQIPAHPMWFNREEIIYQMIHPRSMSVYGYAPTQAILDVVKSLHYSVQWNRAFYEETGIPDAFISLKDASAADYERFKEYWQREIIGKPHKLPIVNTSVEIKPLSMSQKELEFLESQQWYFKLVISTFGLTPAELGFTEDINRATGVSQAEVVRRKAIRPLIRIIEQSWDEVIKEFGFFDVEFKYTVKDIIEEGQKVDIQNKQLQSGLRTINEIRVENGMMEVSWGDVPMQLLRFAPQIAMGGGSAFEVPGGEGQPQSELTQPLQVTESEAEIRARREMQEELNATRQVLKPMQAQMIGVKPQIIVDITTAPPGPVGSIKSIKYTCRWCKERYDEKLDRCPKCGGPLREERIKVFYKQVGDSAAVGFGNLSRPIGGEQHVPLPQPPLQDAHPEVTGIANKPPSKSEGSQTSPFRDFKSRCPSCGFEGLVFQGIQQADSFYPIETDWYSCPRCGMWIRTGEPDLLSMQTMARQGENRGPFYGEGGPGRLADTSGIEIPTHGGVPTATSEGISGHQLASVGQGIQPEPSRTSRTYAESYKGKKKILKVMEPVKQEPEVQYLNVVRPDSYEQYKIEEKCPLCSSPHVEFVGGFAFHCLDCNFDWTDRINVNPILRDPRGTGTGQPMIEPGGHVGFEQVQTQEIPDLTGSQPPMSQTTYVRKVAEVDDIKAWAGFNYVPFLEKILEFIRNYNFGEITDTNKKQIQSIRNILLRGFKQGYNISKISSSINRVIGDKDKAESIARTEIIRATNEGKLKEMEDRDVEKVKWLIAPDERTCEICKKEEGKILTLEKATGQIPAHPNCRCTWIPYVK